MPSWARVLVAGCLIGSLHGGDSGAVAHKISTKRHKPPIALFRKVKQKKSPQKGKSFGKTESTLTSLADAGDTENKVGFMIAGAQKCGTSYFNNVLRLHKHIWLPFSEPHYFDNNFNKGEKWYADHFVKAPPGSLLGEKTPDYMRTQSALIRIKRYNKDMKLLFFLRDPVKVCEGIILLFFRFYLLFMRM
jgi:hypothetical protein